MGGQADVPHHPLLFHVQQKVQDAAVPVGPPVLLLVQAVDHAVVDVVGLELGELPVHRAFHRVQIGGPAVLPSLIVGAEMHLVADIFPHRGEGRAVVSEGARLCSGQVGVVHPVLVGEGQGVHRLPLAGVADVAGAQADDADPVAGGPVDPVFHENFLHNSYDMLILQQAGRKSKRLK